MVGIVASTGGPHAVETVLATIGPDFPIPIVLVQHMTASFHGGFMSWLDRISPQTVTEARHGELPEPGHVYVAPADKHLVGSRRSLGLERQPASQRTAPVGHGPVAFDGRIARVRTRSASCSRAWATTAPRACWRFAAPADTRSPKTNRRPS